jgi:hypothetical protein
MRVFKNLIFLLSVLGYRSVSFADQTLSIGLLQSQYVTESAVATQSNHSSSFIPNFKAKGSYFRDFLRTEADISSIIPMQRDGEFHVWFPTLNVQYGDRLESSTESRRTQVTLGRALKPWSQLDTEWSLGLWQPQFRWDYIRPAQMGLTGLFYETQKQSMKFTAFLSGLYLPDQQGEFEIKDGELVSENRWFRPPVSELQIKYGTKNIDYELDKPSVSRVIWNPSYGMAIRGGEEDSGPWIQFAMADKPANQFHIGIDTERVNQLNGTMSIKPVIHPKLVRHRLLTAEAGFKNEATSFYASVTSENFEDPKLPELWEQSPLRDSLYYGIGASQVVSALGYRSAVYSGLVFKDYVGSQSAGGSMSEEMSSSVQKVAFDKLWNVGLRYPMHPRVYSKWSSEMKYTYSFSDRAEWVMAQLNYRPYKDWSFFMGADILGSPNQIDANKMSFISKYRDNDRIEGGFTHVF